MAAYRPRRSSKRWTQDAPEYVLACYDNNGRTADRYSVLFGGTLWEPRMGRNVYVLGMSGAPSHPQGVSMWAEMPAYNRKALGRHVRWLDLPEHIREHVIARATESHKHEYVLDCDGPDGETRTDCHVCECGKHSLGGAVEHKRSA